MTANRLQLVLIPESAQQAQRFEPKVRRKATDLIARMLIHLVRPSEVRDESH